MAIARVQGLWLLGREREAAVGFWRFTTRWQGSGGLAGRADCRRAQTRVPRAFVVCAGPVPFQLVEAAAPAG